MPTLTRWFIKSSMIYLVAALLLSLLLSLHGIMSLPAFVNFLNPVFFHLLVVGWVTQMIFGVIYWMFPIITRQNPRAAIAFSLHLWQRVVPRNYQPPSA